MQIDLNELRRHYASLSDEALLELNPDELTEAARQCYEQETASRNWVSESNPDTVEDGPEWLEGGACACNFAAYPGSNTAPDALEACELLQAEGIPAQVSTVRIEPEKSQPQSRLEYRVMVPGALTLRATSILDKEIFNAEMEADWRAHLEGLDDEELQGLSPEIICAGLLDRVERLKHAYADEVARRQAIHELRG